MVQANTFHPTIKFTAEISKYWNNILGYMSIQGRPIQKALFQFLDVRTHFKPTETATLQASGKASSNAKPWGFLELTLQKRNLKNTLHYSNKDYAIEVIQITFWIWFYLKSILAKECRLYKINKKTRKRILPFVTEYRPTMPDLKHILMNKWHLIQNQPRKIFKNPPLISYRRGRSLKDVLVRAKLWGLSISYLDQ